jgi:hypothetical protein
MTADSAGTLQAEIAFVTIDSSFQTLQVSAQGDYLDVSWFIQK